MMTPREIVTAQIRHQDTDPVPYTLNFDAEVAERLDAYYGTPDWRGQMVQYIDCTFGITHYPFEPLDDHHSRDAFGSVWRHDGEAPAIIAPGLPEPSFAGYAFPSPETFLDPARKAEIQQQLSMPSDKFRLLFSNVCLWESWNLRGFEETLMDSIADEDFFAELLERMTTLCLTLLNEFADVPSDAIMMGDDWGDQRGVILGPERWRRFYKPCYARIFDAIHAQGKQAIMHCCGSMADIIPDLIEIGLDVLESVQPEAAGMNPYGLKRMWGDRMTFWGGLGTQQTIPFGTPDEIRAEIRHLRREMSRGGGYILAPAKSLRPETPTENAVAVFEEFVAS